MNRPSDDVGDVVVPLKAWQRNAQRLEEAQELLGTLLIILLAMGILLLRVVLRVAPASHLAREMQEREEDEAFLRRGRPDKPIAPSE